MSSTRHIVEKTCKRVLGSIDETVVDKVVSGIKLNYEKDEIIERLKSRIDQKDAVKLVEKVFSKVKAASDQQKLSSSGSFSNPQSHKRSRDESGDEKLLDTKRVRGSSADDRDNKNGSCEKNDSSKDDDVEDPQLMSTKLTPDEIKRMMNDAKRWLEEKKHKTDPVVDIPPTDTKPIVPNQAPAVVTASVPTVPKPGTVKTDAASTLAARAAELRSKINSVLGSGLITPAVAPGSTTLASGLATPGGFLSTAKGLATPIFPGIQTPAFLGGSSHSLAALIGQQRPKEPMPGPLVLDAEGQTVNATTGEKLALTPRMPTLKANIRAKKQEEFKQLLSNTVKKESLDTRPESSPHFDPRVEVKPPVRQPRRSFKFHEEGKFQTIAKKFKMKAQLEKLHREISDAARRTGIQAAVKLALVQPKVEHKEGVLPSVEWWDGVLLPHNTYEDCRKQTGVVNKQGKLEKYNTITHLVEHPTLVKCPDEDMELKPLKLHLTKKEQKKFRSQRRREEQKEKTEKIRLGLLPQPEPKVKISNLMRVLGNDAIQDPTKVEAHVRAQMAKRQKAHELANAARKLNAEQLRNKKIRKLKEDVTAGVNVSVYRLKTLFNPSHKFKVVENSKQLLMTGVALITEDIVVVVVEGGPKQQQKFKNLMLKRIQWKEDMKKRSMLTTDEKTSESLKTNKCDLVWEGVVKYRSFPELKPKMFQSVTLVREYLKRLNVEHYWDLAHAQAVLESSDS